MAEEETSKITIIDQREEIMIDHTTSQINQNPIIRTAHFLKPTSNPNLSPPKLPKIQSFSLSTKPNFTFICKSQPIQGYKTWVENLEKTHENLWQKVGIFDAIKCSTYHISKNIDLIFHLVEKWCPQTNTFVLPWGEIAVTLEDVFVLGGFSPLGVSVMNSNFFMGENVKNVEFIENKLIKILRELAEIDHNRSQVRWMNHFMNCGGELECAGFLALWLARHVFPTKTASAVTKSVLPIAARISCGAKYAFGPAILASIYRDLTLLKRRDVGCNSKILSPMHLVQVWAWERILLLGPVPRMINPGETRLARWESHRRKMYDEVDVEMILDSCRETFRWRPYGMLLENWKFPRFYVDLGTWVVVDSSDKWELFAKCVMVCELVGLNCAQAYNPHRVALQFGYDQDIPVSIDRYTVSNVEGLRLYVPPRLHEGDVTFRYSNWWRTQFSLVDETLVGCRRKKRTRKRMKEMSKICENPLEKSSPSEEVPSPDPLQMGEDTGVNVEEEEENEAREYLDCCVSVNEAVNVAEPMTNPVEGMTSQTEPRSGAETPIEHENDQMFTKLAELDLSKNCQHNASDQNNEQNLISSSSECNETPINVAGEMNACGNMLAEDEPREGINMNHSNITDDSQVPPLVYEVDDCDELNLFAALCLEYESRISRLEEEISALMTAYGTSNRG